MPDMPGNRAAAAEAVALDQRDTQALARRRHRRRDAGRTTADHQHVAGERRPAPLIHHRHGDLHLMHALLSLSYDL